MIKSVGSFGRILQRTFQQRDIPLNLIAAGLDFLGISVVIQSRFSKARFHLPIICTYAGRREYLFVNDACKMDARGISNKAGNVMPRIGHGLVAAFSCRFKMCAMNTVADYI